MFSINRPRQRCSEKANISPIIQSFSPTGEFFIHSNIKWNVQWRACNRTVKSLPNTSAPQTHIQSIFKFKKYNSHHGKLIFSHNFAGWWFHIHFRGREIIVQNVFWQPIRNLMILKSVVVTFSLSLSLYLSLFVSLSHSLSLNLCDDDYCWIF